jgi:hypothetical protein
MKTSSSKPGKPGFVSYVLVLTTGAILTMLMVFTYRQAMATQAVQSQVQLRNDYSEKEDAILRSIVAITPNRAIRAMQSGSASSMTVSNPLRWEYIFGDALAMANARTSISPDLLAKLNVTNPRLGNSADSTLTNADLIFHQIPKDKETYDTSYASAGINRILKDKNESKDGFPVPLETNNDQTKTRDATFPIISNYKLYGPLAQSFLNDKDLNGDGEIGYGVSVETYSKFNILKYPEINFGYAKPGDPFVAKRNWWAFTLDMADHDDDKTKTVKVPRDFVLSIYEIPSQLAISASSFLSLGQYASGEAWQNVNIKGGVFAGKAEVQGALGVVESDDENRVTLASRRGMTLPNDAMIGGKSVPNNPFTPGVREAYQVTEGEFFPVSLASESGRVAFIPINRGEDFFDRFAHTAEVDTVSTTTWNHYSVGAMQCAMRLDIIDVVSSLNSMPTMFRFDCLLPNGSRRVENLPLVNKTVLTSLPSGYVYKGEQTGYPTPLPSDQSFTFNVPTDLAYGYAGRGFGFIMGFTGTIRFNNETFGNPAPGYSKKGYARPASPFQLGVLPNGQHCVKVLPERIAGFLSTIGAADTSINNSLVVNVDYTTASGSINLTKPAIPCIVDQKQYGLILEECHDLTTFSKGFSLVSNLRTYIGDDFNMIPYASAPPAGYTPPADGYFPACSLFVPEKRYGVEIDPYAINFDGRLGSLTSDDAADPTRPLDSKSASGSTFAADRITVNLRPITHPVELPPITMMNWLVVLEERRKQFLNY